MKTSTIFLPPLRSVKVLDQLRERLRYQHYSIRTEQAYVHWVRAFIRFHGLVHPLQLDGGAVEAFLSWLASERGVSSSTHRQASAALLTFYGKVLGVDLPWMKDIGRPRHTRRLPVVLAPDEVARIIAFLDGEHRLLAQQGHRLTAIGRHGEITASGRFRRSQNQNSRPKAAVAVNRENEPYLTIWFSSPLA